MNSRYEENGEHDKICQNLGSEDIIMELKYR